MEELKFIMTDKLKENLNTILKYASKPEFKEFLEKDNLSAFRNNVLYRAPRKLYIPDYCYIIFFYIAGMSLKEIIDVFFLDFNHALPITKIIIPNNVKVIYTESFQDCSNLEFIELPVSITRILSNVFFHCPKLKVLNYQGTKKEWVEIKKEPGWISGSYIEQIKCSNGIITL